MLINSLLDQDFHSKYKFYSGTKHFEDIQALIIHLIGLINTWSSENTEEKQLLKPEIAHAILSRFQLSLPFIFSLKSEQLLNQISLEFQLIHPEKDKLRSLIFNFGIKSVIENEFGYKFIRFSFKLM